jgi:ribonuclease HII
MHCSSTSKPSFFHEQKLGGVILGIDEVGRGCVAGPVFAAGIILNDEIDTSEINDSKKLNIKKRERIYNYLIQNCHYALGISSVEEIERINILQASLLAMRRVIAKMQHHFDYILVDGNVSPNKHMHNIITIVGGDKKSLSIAAASIIAKITRDRFMENLGVEFPQYDFKKNKGYCSSKHSCAIKKYGTSIHHRKSFLKKIIGQKNDS